MSQTTTANVFFDETSILSGRALKEYAEKQIRSILALSDPAETNNIILMIFIRG